MVKYAVIRAALSSDSNDYEVMSIEHEHEGAVKTAEELQDVDQLHVYSVREVSISLKRIASADS